MLKINPGKSTVWLRPDTIQIGLEADAVIVGGLSPAHQRFIRALQSGIADNQLGAIAKSTRVGEIEAGRLIDRLAGAMLQRPPNAPLPSGDTRPILTALRDTNPDFAELIRIALNSSVDGAAVMAQRAARVIHIERFDKTGVTLLRGLSNAGFSQFWSGDTERILEDDIQALGYSTEQLGRPRLEGVESIVAGFANAVSVTSTKGLRMRVIDKVDLAILIAQQTIEPRRYKRLIRYGVPHIAITFDELGARVSPLVVPNKTPCLGCLDLALNALDSNHEVRVTQLAHAAQRYDDASAVLFAAAMTVASASEFLDSQQGFAQKRFERLGWQFERASGRVLRIDWPTLPSCDCFNDRALPGHDDLSDLVEFESAQEPRRA